MKLTREEICKGSRLATDQCDFVQGCLDGVAHSDDCR